MSEDAEMTEADYNEKRRLIVKLLESESTFDEKKLLELVRSNPELCTECYDDDCWQHEKDRSCWQREKDRSNQYYFMDFRYEKSQDKDRNDEFEDDVCWLLLRICVFRPSLALVQAAFGADPDGTVPLHVACESDASLEVIRFLVSTGPADTIKEKVRRGYLPLHCACRVGASLEVIQFLVSSYQEGKKEKAENGALPLHLACAQAQTPTGVIEFLVSEYPDGAKEKDVCGMLPLHLAAVSRLSLAVIRFLVSQYHEGLKEQDSSECTPLFLACEFGASLEVIQFLVSEHPDSLNTRGDGGMLPLHALCRRWGASLEKVEYLSSAYPDALKATDEQGMLPLHAMCKNRTVSLEAVEYLSSAYSDGLKTADEKGRLPLHLSCWFEPAPLQVIQYLSLTFPDGLKAKQADGSLPLHLACNSEASIEVIAFLVSQYQGGLMEQDKEGQLPLHLVCKNGYSNPYRQKDALFELLRFLVSKHEGAVKEKDKYGQLPLHAACNERAASLALIRFLVSKHLESPMEADESERLPIHHACLGGASFEVICFLASKYQEGITMQDDMGYLPFHFACSSAKFETVSFLLASYQDSIKATTRMGYSPLHSIEYSTFDVTSFLLSEYQENAKRKDIYGQLPFHRVINSFAPPVPASIICKLVSSYPDSHHIQPRDLDPWSRIGFFLYKQDDFQFLGIFSGDDVVAVTSVTHGPESSHLLANAAARALQFGMESPCLSLSHNLVDKTCAEIMATVLGSDKMLQVLDLEDCGIGIDGLVCLLDALQQNTVLTDLNLSHNGSIFNEQGGQAVAARAPKFANLKKLCLFQRKEEYSMEFVLELMPLLHWKPNSFSPILLNGLMPHAIQAIHYCQQDLHGHILAGYGLMHVSMWHIIFERANLDCQDNADLVFFYLREMLF